MATGRCETVSNITWESGRFGYACVHMGDHNLVGGVRQFDGDGRFEEVCADLTESFGRVNFPEIVRRLDEHFSGMPFSLTTLFREEQRKIVEMILESSLESVKVAYRQQYKQQSLLAAFLGEIGISIPTAFRTTAQLVLNADLQEAFGVAPLDVERIRALLADARTWQVELDEAGLSHQLARSVERCAVGLRDRDRVHMALAALQSALDVVDLLPFSIDLMRTQNVVYKLNQNATLQAQAAGGTDVAMRRARRLCGPWRSVYRFASRSECLRLVTENVTRAVAPSTVARQDAQCGRSDSTRQVQTVT